MIGTVVIATLAGLAVMPLVVLRGSTLRRCWEGVAATWLLALFFAIRLPQLHAYDCFVATAVLSVCEIAIFVALAREVRWSAGRAAVLAAMVYAMAIPAMMRTPIDGDEPYYLLITESMVHDHDLDLRNQYATLAQSKSGRTNLVPQPGDPTGAHGEQYSRHEPFLPILLIPGYAAAGLPGAIGTIALFGVLLVRSTIRWMEEEGMSDAAIRAVFPFFALGPPVLFYAVRIWPEVPAAFCFVEALRGIRGGRPGRWIPALLALVLLKLRFVLVAIGVVAVFIVPHLRRADAAGRRKAMLWLAGAAALIGLPMLVMWMVSGSPTSVHVWGEILPVAPQKYLSGLAGLLVDGAGGIVFQAPFYLFGLFAVTRWRDTPRGFRAGFLASLLYVLYLLPRPEWSGGWSPPLRYLVFLMPVLALGAAAIIERASRGALALAAAGTTALVMHGAIWPWRLFHIANGENPASEWLSVRYGADFSRLFPSLIRVNTAAVIGVAAVLLLIFVGLQRRRVDLTVAIASLLLASGFVAARRPGAVIELEDAHVVHDGGELYPQLWTVSRFNYRGGWIVRSGDTLSFLARSGPSLLHYRSAAGALLEIGGSAYALPATGEAYGTARVDLPAGGRVHLVCRGGEANLDRMTHE